MHYDRAADTWDWDLPKSDVGVWAAAEVARGLGRRGAERTVAIADSACDLTIPRLAAVVRQNDLAYGGESVDLCHGTVVALLITEIAPDVEVHAYEVVRDGLPRQRALTAALEAISASKADVVNLSLGEALLPSDSTTEHGGMPPSLYGLETPTPSCPSALCTSVEAMTDARSGRVVVAAAGNEEGMIHCPGRSSAALSCGFQSLLRRSEPLEQGGWRDQVESGPPNFPQSANVAYVLQQPPDAVGSSFATPLLAGSVALMENPIELGGFMAARYLGALGQAAKLSELTGHVTDADAELALKRFGQALEVLPHKHYEAFEAAMPCVECSAFAEPLYVDLGRHLFELQRFENSERWLRLANKLCPWSADAAANLGAVLVATADGDRERLLEARVLYEEAHTARRDSRTFVELIGAIDAALA